jgi:hypothetical protein
MLFAFTTLSFDGERSASSSARAVVSIRVICLNAPPVALGGKD